MRTLEEEKNKKILSLIKKEKLLQKKIQEMFWEHGFHPLLLAH